MEPVFGTLYSIAIAREIDSAQQFVIYVSPGVQVLPAEALIRATERLLPLSVVVRIDFSEQTLRMGYGSLDAIERLRSANVDIWHTENVRAGILIVDDYGWVFTPTPQYLEAEPDSDSIPNSVALGRPQVEALAIRLSKFERTRVMISASDPNSRETAMSVSDELSGQVITTEKISQIKKALVTAPPVNFDVARQVRVFEPYMQYVELSLTGAAIQRRRVQIPKELQNIGVSKEIEGKLKTTFDLIERTSALSSKELEDELNQIRKDFTPSLGRDHGRVVLKSAKPLLRQRVIELKAKLKAHQDSVQKELQNKLDESKNQIVNYYLPLIKANPPDSLAARVLGSNIEDEIARKWIAAKVDFIVPKAEELIQNMTLEERYKDVTYEALNRPDFLEAVKKAFEFVDWDKAYSEFKAAGPRESAPVK
jgi:hypothetical protein